MHSVVGLAWVRVLEVRKLRTSFVPEIFCLMFSDLLKPRGMPLSLDGVSAFSFFLLARALHYSSRPTGRGRAPSLSPHRARARLGIYER
jgi:hypothetical protein